MEEDSTTRRGVLLARPLILKAVKEAQKTRREMRQGEVARRSRVRSAALTAELRLAMRAIDRVVTPKASYGGSFTLTDEEVMEAVGGTARQARSLKDLLSLAGVLEVYRYQTPPQHGLAGTTSLWHVGSKFVAGGMTSTRWFSSPRVTCGCFSDPSLRSQCCESDSNLGDASSSAGFTASAEFLQLRVSR